jgi:hypothetical protein
MILAGRDFSTKQQNFQSNRYKKFMKNTKNVTPPKKRIPIIEIKE